MAEQMSIGQIETEVRDAMDRAIATGIDEVVQRALREQSWYRTNANTINSGVGILSTVAATVLALGLELPGYATAGLVVLGSLGTLLGVYKTTNGVQDATAVQLRSVVGK